MAVALFAGGVGEFFRLPKVTSYLLAGMLLGPSVLHVVPMEHVHLIEPLTRLAIALVLFNLGCHFPLTKVRRFFKRALKLSAGEMGLTMVLVPVGLLLLGENWAAAILLGALAIATAPATTVLVLKELESEGPVTEYTHALVAINNLISIVLFELLFVGIHFLQGKLASPIAAQLQEVGQDLVGSLFLGIVAGLVVSFIFPLLAEKRRLIALVAVITLLLGTCEMCQVPYLLTFLTMGVTVANSSYHGRQVVAEMDRFTGLLSVIFFVTHGAELDLGALYNAGLIGAGYCALRLSGKIFGAAFAARLCNEEPNVRKWLGPSLMAQAGTAIALSAIAVRRDPELGIQLQSIILGTVVIFEIIGPLMIRLSVLRAGEVPLAHAIRHFSTGPVDQFRTIWNRIRLAIGRDPWGGRAAANLTVNELMRKNVSGVPQTATFDEVVAVIEHSRGNTYPVVGKNSELVGVIRYNDLSYALFDDALGELVRAADVTTRASMVLHPDDPASRACTMFQTSKDDTIPVVTREKPNRLLGVIRHRDILRMLIRGQLSSP